MPGRNEVDVTDLVRIVEDLTRSFGGLNGVVSQLFRGGRSGGAAGFALGGGGKAGSQGSSLGGAAIGAVAGVGGALAGAAFDKTVGFAVNATLRQGEKFSRDVGFRFASNALQFGGQVSFGSNLQASVLQAASNLPFGSAAKNVVDPAERAANRVAAITTAIARGGGSIDPTARKELLRTFFDQEQSAQKEQKAVEADLQNLLGSSQAGGQVAINVANTAANVAQAVAPIIQSIKQGFDLVARSGFFGSNSVASGTARK